MFAARRFFNTSNTVVPTNWKAMGSPLSGLLSGDQFGTGVSLDAAGTTIAVGAWGGDYNNKQNVGITRVYTWNGTSWSLKGSAIYGDEAFYLSGGHVSLSDNGNILAIGADYAWYSNVSTNTFYDHAGQVKIFAWNGSAWIQRGNTIWGESAENYSGWSCSLNGNGEVIVIGGYGNTGTWPQTGAPFAGHFRVFTWNGTTWVQRGNTIIGETQYDYKGYSVDINQAGDVIVVSIPFDDNPVGVDAGTVRVYYWNGTAWIQRGADIYGEASTDVSGVRVGIDNSGNTIIIGAYNNDGNGTNSGHARVYSWNGTSWVKKGSDVDGEAALDGSGIGVSISGDGNIIAIGAWQNDSSGLTDSGHVRVYSWNGTSWIQRGIDLDGTVASAGFGYKVTLNYDGSVVAGSAIGYDQFPSSSSYRGYVQSYQW